MKKLSLSIMVFIFAGLVLAACGHPVQSSPPTEIGNPPVKASAPVLKASWEETWNTTLSNAKKEGSIAIYTQWAPEVRIALTQLFKEKYGINLEISLVSRGAEYLAKVKAENRAGLNIVDVIGSGGPTLVGTMKPEGVFNPIEPLLILPEVKGPEYWAGGRLPFLDKDKLVIAMIGGVSRFILYNTNMIKEGEITNYKDVLKPQYKGKISLNDPTVTGGGVAFISFLAHDIWNDQEANEFLRQLIKQQEVVIQRDGRLQVESVARGKFAIALGPKLDNAAEFVQAGAPLSFATNLKEGTVYAPASGCLAISNRPSHPNATTVFVNAILTKEGQTIFSKSFGSPSIRADVPKEGFFSAYLPQPGEKVYPESEDYILYRVKMEQIAKKIIGEAER